MAYEQYQCTCGAISDLGDITDHVVSKLNDPDEVIDHKIVGELPETVEIIAARDKKARRVWVRQQVQDVLGMTTQELSEALRGPG